MTADHRLRGWQMIAMALGRTVGELRLTLTQREYCEWMARFSIEPCEVDRIDWWNSQILAATINAPFVANGKKRPVTAKEIHPNWWAAAEVKPKGVSGLIAWMHVIAKRSSEAV